MKPMKPAKMWAVVNKEGRIHDIPFLRKKDALYWQWEGSSVVRVLVTPLKPKKKVRHA